MARPLFAERLDSLHPGRLLRTESQRHLATRHRPLALAHAYAAAPPTNDELLDAAKKAYHDFSDMVDLFTTSGVTYSKSSPGPVAALNAYNWKSQAAAPITPTAQSVHGSAIMTPAIASVPKGSVIGTVVIGISESAQVLIGEEGGIGVAFDLQGSPSRGAAYVAGKLGLDIDASFNVQFGLWSGPPSALAGQFYGLEVNLDLEIGVSLGIFVSGDLKCYGFSIGVGVGVGGGATLVGGYTWLF